MMLPHLRRTGLEELERLNVHVHTRKGSYAWIHGWGNVEA